MKISAARNCIEERKVWEIDPKRQVALHTDVTDLSQAVCFELQVCTCKLMGAKRFPLQMKFKKLRQFVITGFF